MFFKSMSVFVPLGTCLLKTHVSFRLEPSAYEYGIYFQENWTDSIIKVSSLTYLFKKKKNLCIGLS